MITTYVEKYHSLLPPWEWTTLLSSGTGSTIMYPLYTAILPPTSTEIYVDQPKRPIWLIGLAATGEVMTGRCGSYDVQGGSGDDPCHCPAAPGPTEAIPAIPRAADGNCSASPARLVTLGCLDGDAPPVDLPPSQS
eukprot:15323878-Ditylum_brightwellii.AAC.1